MPRGDSGLGEERLRRLFDAGRSLFSELNADALLRLVLDAARELTGARYAALGVLDQDRAKVEQFITVGIDDATRAAIGAPPRGLGVLGVLLEEPRPLRLADVTRHAASYGFPVGHPVMSTFLGVPLRIRGEVWGNLYLTEKAGGEEFDEADQEVIELLAGWAASAIDNARLYRTAQRDRAELERTVHALETTTEIARAVGGETRLDRVLELLVTRGRVLVQARGVTLFLMSGTELEVAAVAGEVEHDQIGRRIPFDDSISGAVLRSGRPELVEDAKTSLRYDIGEPADAKSALLVPLVFKSRRIGILGAFDRLVDGPLFTAEDARLLEAFAASAAIAVSTAQDVATRGLRRSIEAAEQERTRWARELHDETVQEQVALKMRLELALLGDDSSQLQAAVERAVVQIDSGIKDLRHLITDLRPASLDEFGAGPALTALAERMRDRCDLDVVLQVDLAFDSGRAQQRLTTAIEATVYRLVQEALTNVFKHAHASHVKVQVIDTEIEVEIVVTDDGEGFNTFDVDAGFGLIGMSERVALAGGSFAIASSPGHGTRITATLPAERRPECPPPEAAPLTG
jgi:signal transduction histidine kinase